MDNEWLSPGEASRAYSVTTQTLRNWVSEGKIEHRSTNGGHFRYRAPGRTPKRDRFGIIYARVSSPKQRSDLGKQVAFLRSRFPGAEVVGFWDFSDQLVEMPSDRIPALRTLAYQYAIQSCGNGGRRANARYHLIMSQGLWRRRDRRVLRDLPQKSFGELLEDVERGWRVLLGAVLGCLHADKVSLS